MDILKQSSLQSAVQCFFIDFWPSVRQVSTLGDKAMTQLTIDCWPGVPCVRPGGHGRWPPHLLLPLPQRNHLQPGVLHLRLVRPKRLKASRKLKRQLQRKDKKLRLPLTIFWEVSLILLKSVASTDAIEIQSSTLMKIFPGGLMWTALWQKACTLSMTR